MQVVRNGEVWFSTLDEALAAARAEASDRREALGPAYTGFIRAGALAIFGWRRLRSLAASTLLG